MREKASSVWILALVAAAGLFHFTPTTSSPAPASSSQTKAADVAPVFPNDGDDITLRLLADHYMTPYAGCNIAGSLSRIRKVTRITEETDAGATRTTKEGPPERERLNDCVREQTIKVFHDTNGKVLIAIVPDPVDGHATYKFDEAIEALQAGAQDADYLLDRFSLPWPRREAPTTDPTVDVERFRSQPGVMIFRKPDTTGSEVVLLLVGETATTGVHETAFVNALEQLETLAGGKGQSEIKVIGPTFSGSMRSIRAALREWAEESFKRIKTPALIHFVSGNSTSLHARFRLEKPFEPEPNARSITVRYHATVLPDKVIQCATSQYLQRTGVDLEKVAVLSESDSFYGRELLTEDLATDECPEYQQYRYQFPYPLQVSQVRTRYQKELPADSQPVSVNENPAHAALHLSVEDADDPRDKPQPYAAGPSANLAELSLTAIFATLNHEHITHVGIFGTDTRDKIFLARLIRSYFPNIQFFTDDSDILYTHPDFAADLWGMLVFSTFPLASQNTTWIRDETWLPNGRNVRQFSSQSGQSLYNAAHLALTDFPLTSEPRYLMAHDCVGDSSAVRFMLDYCAPLYSQEPLGLPVVWITVVGNGGLWPMSTYDPWIRERASRRPPVVSASFNVQATRTFLLAFIGLTGFCLASCVLYFKALNENADDPKKQRPPRYRIFERLGDCCGAEGARLARAQAIVIFSYFILLLTIYLLMSAIMALPPRYWEFNSDNFTLPKVCLVLAVFTVVALVHAVHQSIRSFFVSLKHNWRIATILMIVDGAIACASLLWIRVAKPDELPSSTDIMLYERSIRFGSGVSPVLPLFFLALGVAIWLICFLKRAQLVRYAPEAQPFPSTKESDRSFFHIHGLIRQAMRAPYRFSFDYTKTLGLAAAVLVTLIAAHWAGFFKTGETATIFYSLFWVFFVVLVTGLFWSARDFWIINNHLITLLRKLAFHRLAPAFHRLPPKFSRGLSTNLMDSPPVLVELQEPYDQLVVIRNKFKFVDTSGLTAAQIAAFPSELDKSVSDIGHCLSDELQAATHEPRRSWALSSATYKQLSAEAARLFETLGRYWQGTTFGTFDTAVTPKTRASISKAFSLCEDFVAYQIVGYLNAVFMYMRYLLVCGGSALLFLLMATSSYPFSVQNLMMNFAWVLLLVFSSSYLYVLVQFDRNEVIRAIRMDDKKKTSPLKGTMFSQVILFGLLPALLFLASKFPSLGRLIFSWIGPVVKSLSL